MRIASIVVLLATTTCSAQSWYTDDQQQRIRDRWPQSIPIPEGTKFYRTTKWVQRSAVTDFPQERRYNVLTVGTVTRQLNEWSVPGGLRGVGGWHSYLAVVRGAEIREVDAVESAAGAFGGQLRRVDRRFTKAVFFDLLLDVDYRPFELRAMEVDGDSLDPIVMWRDSSQAPAGYVRPKRSECVACHRRAGESAYATGNVPGGGGVFSYPMLTDD